MTKLADIVNNFTTKLTKLKQQNLIDKSEVR